MSDLLKVDPNLELMTVEHKSPAPKPIKSEAPKLKRVARPVRHIKYIPVKSLYFHTKQGPIDFTYEKKIKNPIPKNKLVVEVKYVALNPIDLKIKNGYASAIYGEIGLGREYSGVVTQVGSKLEDYWSVGDEVYGVYYHPHLANGAGASSLLIDPSIDAILPRPPTLAPQEAAGSLWCLGTAYSIMHYLQKYKYLDSESNVLINGGTTSVGLFMIQLLKYHLNLKKKIVIVTSGDNSDYIMEKFPDIAEEMIFINYLTCRGKSSGPLTQMIKDQRIVDYDDGKGEVTIPYTEGKFDVVLDFVGGYDIVAHSKDLIKSRGAYITTVGDYVSNYKEDIFNSWDNPSANARKMFSSMLWSFHYQHFYFDPNAKLASKSDWINKCGELLESGIVKCVVDKQFNWKKSKEAFAYMATQRARGKIILEVEKF
ncbi:Protein AST1 [Nakaseomyces bracarensis]|uniref:Protein AST1 n=1 Tax=Nakaseomyces bracarensis TaxID=273131 RepID=A0ABR4P0D5_9SACH